jgi:hypothetical protein
VISANFTTLTVRITGNVLFMLIGVGANYFIKEKIREMVARGFRFHCFNVK